MHRRRITLALPAAAAVLAAVPLLTGCGGSETRPGAAALVGGERITVAQVQNEAKLVRRAQEADPSGDRLIQQSGWLHRAALDSLIRQRVVERVAEEAGVHVTPREVEKYRAEMVREARGDERFTRLMLQQRSLAPERIDDDLRMQLLLEKVATRKKVDLRTPRGQRTMRELLQRASKTLHVRVSPRYGTWDDRKVGLGDHEQPWLRDNPARGERLAV